MKPFEVEVALHWGAIACYIASSAFFASAVIFEKERRARQALWLAVAGLVPHWAALAFRWIESGHGPYMARYEVLSASVFASILMLVVFLARRARWAVLGMIVLPVCFLTLAAALFLNPEVKELPPTLRSVWLFFHVLCAKLATGAFLLSVATAALQLGGGPGPASSGWRARLPAREELDGYTVRFVGFGWTFWTITVVAGAIWANQSWGRYWGWDPVETWSLICWLVYGTFLHARLLFRLSPRATAVASIGSFLVFLVTALFLPVAVASLHSSYFQ
ncbi:MAG TPA: cytochrome c biogenesis protein CcsA [Anaeromyxobacteraceae bacterium]|nr:cytochrome c biogenesis protein CcsA [Anaeromyxobacteraceae bacterium]